MDYLSSVNKVLITSGQCLLCLVRRITISNTQFGAQVFFRRQANKLSASLSFELLPSFTLVSCFFALSSTALSSNLPVGDQRKTTFAEVETHKAIRKTIVKMEQLELWNFKSIYVLQEVVVFYRLWIEVFITLLLIAKSICSKKTKYEEN